MQRIRTAVFLDCLSLRTRPQKNKMEHCFWDFLCVVPSTPAEYIYIPLERNLKNAQLNVQWPITAGARSKAWTYLHPLKHFDLGFESHLRHGCLREFIPCLCCPWDSGLVTGWSPRPASPTVCVKRLINLKVAKIQQRALEPWMDNVYCYASK
jgi:hypothetical protein